MAPHHKTTGMDVEKYVPEKSIGIGEYNRD
jgi:hypothetical protein